MGGELPAEMQFDDEFIDEDEDEDEEDEDEEDEFVSADEGTSEAAEHAQPQAREVGAGAGKQAPSKAASSAPPTAPPAAAAPKAPAMPRAQAAGSKASQGGADSGMPEMPWRIGKSLAVLCLGRIEAGVEGTQVGSKHVYPVGYRWVGWGTDGRAGQGGWQAGWQAGPLKRWPPGCRSLRRTRTASLPASGACLRSMLAPPHHTTPHLSAGQQWLPYHTVWRVQRQYNAVSPSCGLPYTPHHHHPNMLRLADGCCESCPLKIISIK